MRPLQLSPMCADVDTAPPAGLADTADELGSLMVTGSRPPTANVRENTGEFERIFSCALDGSVRAWDPYDM